MHGGAGREVRGRGGQGAEGREGSEEGMHAYYLGHEAQHCRVVPVLTLLPKVRHAGGIAAGDAL